MKDLYPKQLEIAQAVAAMLGDVGIKVNIKNLEIATAREHRSAGTYDMFYSGWAHMPHDPDWYFGQWFTKAGAEKLTRYNNPRVEQLVAEGRVPDPKVRQAKYEELEKILWEEEAEIWPYYSVAIYGVSDRLKNFEARRDYYVLLIDVSIA
jgi:peptide/nickel transport system substrate-binding protein